MERRRRGPPGPCDLARLKTSDPFRSVVTVASWDGGTAVWGHSRGFLPNGHPRGAAARGRREHPESEGGVGTSLSRGHGSRPEGRQGTRPTSTDSVGLSGETLSGQRWYRRAREQTPGERDAVHLRSLPRPWKRKSGRRRPPRTREEVAAGAASRTNHAGSPASRQTAEAAGRAVAAPLQAAVRTPAPRSSGRAVHVRAHRGLGPPRPCRGSPTSPDWPRRNAKGPFLTSLRTATLSLHVRTWGA